MPSRKERRDTEPTLNGSDVFKMSFEDSTYEQCHKDRLTDQTELQ